MARHRLLHTLEQLAGFVIGLIMILALRWLVRAINQDSKIGFPLEETTNLFLLEIAKNIGDALHQCK